METHRIVGALGLALLAYALYELDRPWVTLATGLFLLLAAYGSAQAGGKDAA